jgi:hypothetical protein
LRIGFPVDFIDKEIAKIWQIDPNRRIVVEILLSGPYYMDGTLPPNANLCQSSDSELESKSLDDVASFGLGWQLNSRLNDWLKLNWPPKGFFNLYISHYLQTPTTLSNLHNF